MSQQVNRLTLYTPHAKQLEIHNCPKRFAIAAFGRQSGKSTYAINQMLKSAWENPDTKYWFVSPTFPQSRVMYRRLVGMLWPCRDVMVKKNQTELRVKLINNSECRFVSGEVFDNLRGETLNGAIIDEVREQHRDLWPMVIRPMLTTTKGWCRFVSTPNGYDHFYDLVQIAKEDPEWALFVAPSTSNPLFTEEEAQAARRSMTEAQYAQEILAEFRNIQAGRVYYAFGDHNKSEICPWYADKPWSPYHPMIIGPDFNVTPMHWNIGQMVNHFWWWHDEIHLNNSNTPEAAEELAQKLHMYKEQGHISADYDCIILGDASGNARSTKSHDSDYEIMKQVLKRYGIRFKVLTPKANPPIKDRVNAVNARCKSAAGEVGMLIHPHRCKWLIHDLERVLWKTGADFTLDPGPQKTLTHASDGIGYPIAEMSPIKVLGGKAQVKVMARSV